MASLPNRPLPAMNRRTSDADPAETQEKTILFTSKIYLLGYYSQCRGKIT